MELTILILNLLILGGGIYLKSYLAEKAKKLATREEFKEVSKQLEANTRTTEEVKQTIQRAQTAKSRGSDLIIEKMAQIETHLRSWSILIYFRSEELAPNEPIEELGRRDLRKAASFILDLNYLISQFTIYFSEELMRSIQDWSRDMYNLVYEYDAIYQSSLRFHSGKEVQDRDKVAWIHSLIEREIKPKEISLGEKKYKINQRLIQELKLANNEN